MFTRTCRNTTRAVVRVPRSSTRRYGAARARVVEVDDEPVQEPYGQTYGAGPSRIPYQPLPSATLSPPSHRRTRDSARSLRKALLELADGHFSTPKSILLTLGVSERHLSPLERHAILHYLIRQRGRMAPSMACRFLELAHTRPRRVISVRSLAALANPEVFTSRSTKYYRRPSTAEAVDGQPTIEQQRPIQASKQLRRLLELLDKLHDCRHPRPEALFKVVIDRCMVEGRADLAAKVYVRLVEEWIIEGRIAEGADPADFYPGGGPPRVQPRQSPSGASSKLNMWFMGVRTWRLPGEALSPHDRLDLWHPSHRSSHEKLRGYPMPIPTSPPSLVPHPSLTLLHSILHKLPRDPKLVSAAEYAAAMRALAILANTVLSRTLPVPAVPALLRAFADSRTFPLVYPEDFSEEPEKNAWAYTTNTQVHLALVDLMFSPPSYTRALETQDKYQPVKLPPFQDPSITRHGPAQYMLGPLGWKSTFLLIKYGLGQLRQPRLVTNLFSYVRKTWHITSPGIFNQFFRAATRAKDVELAQHVDDMLFGGSALGRGSEKRLQSTSSPKAGPISTSTDLSIFDDCEDDPNFRPGADEHSLAALIVHLTATSQFDRLKKLVYKVMPYLETSSSTSPPAESAGLPQDLIGFSGRALPTELPAHLYVVIVQGLVKGGHSGLAQRVFLLAKSFEDREIKQDVVYKTNVPRGYRYTLPVNLFTAMVELYGSEANRNCDEELDKRFPVGWTMENAPADVTRQQAGEIMAWRTYQEVMSRWEDLVKCHETVDLQKLQDGVPDTQFFNAVIAALKGRWELTTNVTLLPGRRAELKKVCLDMERLGVQPPQGLVSKYTKDIGNGPILLEEADEAEPACNRQVFTPVARAMRRIDPQAKEVYTTTAGSVSSIA